LALAAARVDDEDVRVLVQDLAPLGESREARDLADTVRAQLADPIGTLPEHAPARALFGFTVRRAAPKVGRNDPCPCGSGQKYKKCCEGKPEAASFADQRKHPHRYASAEELGRLPPATLARVDAKELPTEHLIAAARQLTAFHFWGEAERALTELL